MKLAVVGRTLAALVLTCCTNLAAQSSVPAAGSPPVSRVDLPSDPGAPGRFKLKVDVDLVLVEATVTTLPEKPPLPTLPNPRVLPKSGSLPSESRIVVDS